MLKSAFIIKLLLSISTLILGQVSSSQGLTTIEIDSIINTIESSIKNKASIKNVGLRKLNDAPTFLYDYYVIDTSEKKLLKVITKEINETKVEGHKRRGDTSSYYYVQRDTIGYDYYFLNDELIKVIQENGVTTCEYYFKGENSFYKIIIVENKIYPITKETASELFLKKAKKFIHYYKEFPDHL